MPKRALENFKMSLKILVVGLVFLASLILFSVRAMSDETRPNLPVKTLGGTQFWRDAYLHAGWRIQQNILTDHYRLLDPGNVRRAWGEYQSCKSTFDEIRQRQGIVPSSVHLVVLVHGIARSWGTFPEMGKALIARGYDVASISYPSTRSTIEEHADGIARLLGRLEGTETISFVTHSMGGLVIRHLLARDGAWKRQLKVNRIVLIAPPNQGSSIAKWLKDFPPYKVLYGHSGQQLTPAKIAKIPAIIQSFGIIAGGTDDGEGFNPILKGNDDGTVAVDETRLSDADDFIIIPEIHARISNHPKTIEATINFLESGKFNRY